MTDFNKASNLTTDNINKHIFAHAEKLGVKNLAGNNLKALNLCQIYTIARPILQLAKSILFFNTTWQSVIGAVIAALDTECPTSVPPAA
jgi:hypothetical protein